MCCVSRKTKGRHNAMVSGTKLFKGDALIRIMSSAPILSCSMVSFSEPRAPLGNTFTPSLPPLAVASCLPMNLTASTVG